MRPPPLWDHLHEVQTLLEQPPFGLVCDIDGTISPIAPTPPEAYVPKAIRTSLADLRARGVLVAVISGRPSAEARSMVGLDGVVYIGGHGAEGTDGSMQPELDRWRTALVQMADDLRPLVEPHGVFVEVKDSGVAFHYRTAADPTKARRAIETALAAHELTPSLQRLDGRQVVELRVPGQQNKGTALEWLVRRYGLRSVLYLGDDVTDLDAFRALRRLREAKVCHGLALVVLAEETAPSVAEGADYALTGVEDVARLLQWLSTSLPSRARRDQ